MAHRAPLTPEQHQKLQILKDALNGDGDALDTVVDQAPTETPVFGSDRDFHSLTAPVTINVQGSWEPIDNFDLTLVGGRYYVDLLVFFTGNTTNRDYQVRFNVNGSPTGDTISKELKDADDEIEYSTFNEYVLPAGPLNIACEALISTGGGAPDMTVTRWRVRIYRVALS